ncbi:hypothetical protein [Streptomyces sp. NPDC087317]|uniref:hypothetical protein n=1 Tax=Streptomyces sp. NPDC087317 TaxID=3365784 RepID=UPI00380FCEF3
MLLAGTSRTKPPTQYADTCPSSQSMTASGPFSKRGSAAAATVVFFAAAFGRDGGAAAGAGAGTGSGAGPVNASGTAGGRAGETASRGAR